MIRFRLGQSWKREAQALPKDAFAIDVDGVNLLSGVNDEPLDVTVADFVEGILSLAKGQTHVLLSLPESHFEIFLQRRGTEVVFSTLTLASPARWIRPGVTLELEELVTATARLGREWWSARTSGETAAEADGGIGDATRRKLLRSTQALERWLPSPGLQDVAAAPLAEAPTTFDAATDVWAFGFEVQSRAPLGKSAHPLIPLLRPGSVWLRGPDGTRHWETKGTPFLLALELSRQAQGLGHAVETSDARFETQLATTPPFRLTADLAAGNVSIGGKPLPATPAEIASAMFHLGIDLAIGLGGRAGARNVYLGELTARSKEGLTQLRAPTPPSTSKPNEVQVRSTKAEPALETPGQLKRLKFEPLWEKTHLSGVTPSRGHLLAGAKGPIVATVEVACAFAARGELLGRQVSTHGVAVGARGDFLVASANRIAGFRLDDGVNAARWMRDHDGTVIGPTLERHGSLLLGRWGPSAVVAFCAVTGRELWRLDPPKTQRADYTCLGQRVLVTTDSGYLYGLALEDGQVRFRMRAAMPFVTPAVAWAKRFTAVMERGSQSALVVADADAGTIHWATELDLQRCATPLPKQGRVFVAGERQGQAHLACLNAKGEKLWERAVPLGHGPFSLLAVERSVVVSQRRGAAVCVSATGELEWRLGESGEELPVAVPAQLRRGVLVLPGERIRAVAPKEGTVLAEVRAGPGLCALLTDARLNLYSLDEDGRLRAFRLASHLAVVR